MRTLLILTFGWLLCCGCYSRAEIEQAKTEATQNAAAVYRADAEYQRGLNEGFKRGLAYPSQVEK